MVSLIPVLHFSLVYAQFQDNLKNKINRMYKFAYTNTYRQLLAAL
jgi:hypothetical protein